MTQPEITEEELRRLEAELERISVDDVLLQTTITLLNLAARKAGLAPPPPGTQPPPPDWEQVRQAIEGARALLPQLESRHGDQLGQIRDTLAQLQMIYAQRAGGGGGEPAPETPEPEAKPGDPGPAQRTGRLWIPGQ